jgi:hypothetical protein
VCNRAGARDPVQRRCIPFDNAEDAMNARTVTVGVVLLALGFGLGFLVAWQFASPGKTKYALADSVTGKWKLIEQKAKEGEPDVVVEIGPQDQITYPRRVTYRGEGGFLVGRGVDTLRGKYHFIDDEHLLIEGKSEENDTTRCLLRVSIKGKVLKLNLPFYGADSYERLE